MKPKAIRAVCNRKTKSYDVETLAECDPIVVFSGWFVYDGSAADAVAWMNRMGTFSDAPRKRAAVLAHLSASS